MGYSWASVPPLPRREHICIECLAFCGCDFFFSSGRPHSEVFTSSFWGLSRMGLQHGPVWPLSLSAQDDDSRPFRNVILQQPDLTESLVASGSHTQPKLLWNLPSQPDGIWHDLPANLQPHNPVASLIPLWGT